MGYELNGDIPARISHAGGAIAWGDCSGFASTGRIAVLLCG